MNTHVIYIPHSGHENVLSQQLAHAFAKYRCDGIRNIETVTMIVQHGADAKPLEGLASQDTLQVLFTPIYNLNAPLHTQTSYIELLRQLPMLITHLLQDGFTPSGCTIQLYTLEHSDQSSSIIKKLAEELVAAIKIENLTIEWHIIPRLTSLTHEQLNQIFEPTQTLQTIVHAFLQEDGKVKILESHNFYHHSRLH